MPKEELLAAVERRVKEVSALEVLKEVGDFWCSRSLRPKRKTRILEQRFKRVQGVPSM